VTLTVFAIVSAVIAAVLSVLGVLSVRPRNDILELAFSDVPLGKISPEPKRLLVELVRRRDANSRTYSQIASTMRPLSPPLYSAESFANEKVCRGTAIRLTQSVEADFGYFAQQEQAGKEFSENLMRIAPTSDLLKADQWQASASVGNELEHTWLSSTVGLYDYAASHAKDITIKNGTLEFSTESVRREFNRQLATSKDLFQKFQDRVQDSIKQHKQERAAAGLSN